MRKGPRGGEGAEEGRQHKARALESHLGANSGNNRKCAMMGSHLHTPHKEAGFYLHFTHDETKAI